MKKIEVFIPYFLFALFLLALGFVGVIDKSDLEKIFPNKNSLKLKYTPSYENELGE
tara:strand:- start:1008 stop:1175 length:168 start_codon:yes stop_codon:yes gene_type:complete